VFGSLYFCLLVFSQLSHSLLLLILPPVRSLLLSWLKQMPVIGSLEPVLQVKLATE
jgi:hypothetical protein